MDVFFETRRNEGGDMAVHGFVFGVDPVCRGIEGRQQVFDIDDVILQQKRALAGHGRIGFVETAFVPIAQIADV